MELQKLARGMQGIECSYCFKPGTHPDDKNEGDGVLVSAVPSHLKSLQPLPIFKAARYSYSEPLLILALAKQPKGAALVIVQNGEKISWAMTKTALT